jgi:protein phosphatase
MTLTSGDILVLCTDGLWGLVQEAEILQLVTSSDARTACDELVKLARKRGGPDNITLQVLRLSSNGLSAS